MNRINFFQLLELRIQPPESDPDVIDAAIKHKQSEWSRLRNHPTKGMVAKQNINLLPEIRRVMLDPTLRSKEAAAAAAELRQRQKAKIAKLDDHIRLLGAKGDLSEADLRLLSQTHLIKPALVQKRIDAWESRKPSSLERELDRLMVGSGIQEADLPRIAQKRKLDPQALQETFLRLRTERLAEIDTYFAIQARKGYATQEEIFEVAMLSGIPEGDILRRIRVPVKKVVPNAQEGEQSLDETVEKVIEENLKVVGASSLYDFLGLWPSSHLDAIQKKATEKESEIRRIAHKDALVTAGGILAGHCLAIFKSDVSRYAYDVSRARSLLNDLAQDIRLVAGGGRLQRAFFVRLLRKAMGFGTPPAQARQHILDQCKAMGVKADPPRFRRKQSLRAVYWGVGIGTVVVLVAISALLWREYRAGQARRAYDVLAEQMSAAAELEEKKRLLETYIAGTPPGMMAARAKLDLAKIGREMIERDHRSALEAAEPAMADGRYEEAARHYREFVDRHPGAPAATVFRQHLAEIPDRIEQRDFEAVAAPDPARDLEGFMAAAEAYMARHPGGKHSAQVHRLLEQNERTVYAQTLEALEACEAADDWGECIAVANRYIDLYRDSTRAVGMRSRRDDFRIRQENVRVLRSLKTQALQVADDPQAAYRVYKDFLERHPRSSARELIEAEIEGLSTGLTEVAIENAAQEVRNRLQETRTGFSEKAPHTLTDARTGLVWSMVDSTVHAGRCFTYEEAQRFAEDLGTGGFTDWRLPGGKELEGVLSGTEPFPGILKGEWYWTAESYRRYAGGWISEVNVVSPGQDTRQRDSRDCGWVLAVRP